MNPTRSRYYVYIKPVIKNPYVRTYSSAVFSLIAIAFFSFFAIRPTLKTIVGLQKSIGQQQQVLKLLDQKSKDLDTGIKNYNAIDQSTLDKIDSLIPTRLKIAGLINDLSSIAYSNQASVSGILIQPFTLSSSDQPVTSVEDLKEVSFTMNIIGNYPSLKNTLNQITHSNHLITLDNISFNKSEDKLIMSLTGKAKY